MGSRRRRCACGHVVCAIVVVGCILPPLPCKQKLDASALRLDCVPASSLSFCKQSDNFSRICTKPCTAPLGSYYCLTTSVIYSNRIAGIKRERERERGRERERETGGGGAPNPNPERGRERAPNFNPERERESERARAPNPNPQRERERERERASALNPNPARERQETSERELQTLILRFL